VHHNIAAYEAAVRRHVTVLIPWHGRDEDLLRETLRSLPRGVRVMIAKNRGKDEMAAALNEALGLVTTKYVFCMGADDVVDSKTLWRLWEATQDYDGAYPWMLGFGAQRFRFAAEPWSVQRIQDANVCGVFLVKTRVLRSVGGWRDVPIEDWDLMYRVARAGYRLNPAPLARYGYRQRENGLHRSTVREAARLEMSWQDLAPYETGERLRVRGVFYSWKLDGTSYVRCELPARTVGGVARISWDSRDAHEAGAWVYQYPNSDAQEMWELASKMGKRRVIDVDDNYLAPDLGDVVGAYYPENGRAWSERQESHRRMCEEADAIICATPRLAEWYQEVNKNVFVCENTVDPIDWPKRSSKKKIVGVVLSTNHMKHFHLVEDALRAASRIKGVEVEVVGLDPDWDFSYTHIGFTPGVHAYRRVLSRWSVGLAPVIDNNVTSCKSDLKWLEFTMSGAAMIASRVAAYDACPDGLILRAEGASEFSEQLVRVLGDESFRRRLVRDSAAHIKKYRLVGNDGLRSRYNTALGC
jgi:hypothetical protein